MGVETYEPGLTRPDLVVPLSPLRPILVVLRSHLLGSREPSFAQARRVTQAAATTGFAFAIASLWAPAGWQEASIGLSALIGAYAIWRSLAANAYELRQHTFGRDWIVAQSEVLRHHAFEILRFTVQDLSGDYPDESRDFDLSRPVDIRELLHRQEADNSAPRSSRVTVEFGYLARDAILAVAEVHRDLKDLKFLVGRTGSRRPWIQFPQAYYVGRNAAGGHPARRTSWALAGSVVIAVPEPVFDGPTGWPTGLAEAVPSPADS